MVFVGLFNVPLINVTPEPVVPPVNPPVTLGALQLYVVPDGITPSNPSVGVTPNNTPLHVVAVIALTAAFGLLVTVTVNVPFDPHKLELGVTI